MGLDMFRRCHLEYHFWFIELLDVHFLFLSPESALAVLSSFPIVPNSAFYEASSRERAKGVGARLVWAAMFLIKFLGSSW